MYNIFHKAIKNLYRYLKMEKCNLDKSLVATKEEFDRFNSKLNEFWELFYVDGENYLVAFENFLNDPLSTLVNIQEKFDLEINNNINTQLTVKLDIDYEKKFINFAEIKEWFAE